LQAEDQPAGALHRRLAGCDPAAAQRIHPHDLARVVRALEVHELTGRPISQWQREHAFVDRPYRAVTIGLSRERVALRGAIGDRCADMVRQGLADEVRRLWASGYGSELAPLRTLGYRHMGAYLDGRCTLPAALAQMVTDTCRYAKRQMTWFRRDADVRWFDADHEVEAARRLACRFVEAATTPA
jgi:tRNA dimethylallyltransferase